MIALKHERIGVAIDPDCGGGVGSLRLCSFRKWAATVFCSQPKP